MALRLKVNDELGELERLLDEAPKRLKPGGRFVVLTFMSLEDRKVKQSFQALARAGQAKILTKHVVTQQRKRFCKPALQEFETSGCGNERQAFGAVVRDKRRV